MAGEKDSFSLDESQTIKTSFKINKVPTNADALTLANEGAFGAGEFVITPDEDVNLDCLRTELLWTNPSPTAAFEAQSVTLAKPWSNYDSIIIEWADYNRINGSSDYTNRITNLNWFKIREIGLNKFSTLYMISGNTVSTVLTEQMYKSRAFYANSSTTLYFEIGVENKGQDNYQCIPINIYGVLKTPAMIYTGVELHEGNGISIENGVINIEKGELAGAFVPSATYEDLGTSSDFYYTPPVNGYIALKGVCSTNLTTFAVIAPDLDAPDYEEVIGTTQGYGQQRFIPVRKGVRYRIAYSNVQTSHSWGFYIRFYYAQGEI